MEAQTGSKINIIQGDNDKGHGRIKGYETLRLQVGRNAGLAHQALQKNITVQWGETLEARGPWALGPKGTLAWCRSTPYMDSFLAFSRKWISASPGVMPLVERKGSQGAMGKAA